jgi:hypothetical protein
MMGAKVTLLICMLLLANCVRDASRTDTEPDFAKVTGIVTFVRGWGATDFPLPDSSYFDPRALADVKVSLLEYFGDGKPPGEVVAQTDTDTLGRYQLVASPGDYYLVLHAASFSGILTASDWFDPAEQVSHLEVIELVSGQTLTRDMEVHEMVPQ